MIPSFALAFSFIMLLLLGYTLYRSDVGCFSGLAILFIALCLFIIGKYNELAISDLSDNVISKIKRRKYLFNLIFISATVGLTILYILFYFLSTNGFMVLLFSDFLSVTIIDAIAVIIFDFLIYYLLKIKDKSTFNFMSIHDVIVVIIILDIIMIIRKKKLFIYEIVTLVIPLFCYVVWKLNYYDSDYYLFGVIFYFVFIPIVIAYRVTFEIIDGKKEKQNKE